MTRTRNGWGLNSPWYTDWVVWVTAVVVPLRSIQGVSQLSENDPLSYAFDFLIFFVVGLVFVGLPLLVVRGLVRKLAHIEPGPIGSARAATLVVPISPTASVTYTRTAGGRIIVALRGVPDERRDEALAVARRHAEARGFLVPQGRTEQHRGTHL